MSYNNFNSCYSCTPCAPCAPPKYKTDRNNYNNNNNNNCNKCAKSCKKKYTKCKCTKCEQQCQPCQPYQQCQPCQPYQPCPPCPPCPVNRCPIVSYTTTAPTATAVPSGTAVTLGAPTPIITFSTAPIVNGGLANTTTNNICINGVVMAGLTNANLINMNNAGVISNSHVLGNQLLSNNLFPIASAINNNVIILNTATGQFIVPSVGRYLITGFIGFAEAGTGGAGVGTRQFYIYKIDGTTGTITLLAEDSRNAVTSGNTYISLSTVADLNANDRIYFAVGQNSLVALSTTIDGRFTINRLC